MSPETTNFHRGHVPGGPLGPNEWSDQALKAAAMRLQVFFRSLPKELGANLFGDAILMMLLELLVAELDKRRLPIKSVSIGSGVPQSTALRYIDHLERAKLIKRHANPADRRSAHIALTPEASQRIRETVKRLFAGLGYS